MSPTASGQPFVGREQELKQLQTAFDVAAAGQGSLVMVVGEPGIGKTALCQQLAAHVRECGGSTLFGHCYEEGSLSLPYLAFVEALRDYTLEHDAEEIRSQARDGAVYVARIVPELRTRLGISVETHALPEDDPWRLMQAVADFLRAAATTAPLAIFLEDLHWADSATMDLLQHVARNLSDARIVVIGTYRDVEVDRAHPLSASLAELRRTTSFLRIALRGLSVDEVHRYYEASRGNEIPRNQAELVHRQTEGNPLFVQELLRFLVDEGYVVRKDDRYVYASTQPPDTIVPEGLRDVVGRRFSRLSETCNRILSMASVIGRDFHLDTLRRVSTLPFDEVVDALEEALASGVLEEHARPGVIEYRFTHAFFRQTLYEEMSAARRLRLHQEVGRTLEEEYVREPEAHAVELAQHFSHSTDPADLAKAVRYCELAARRATAVYAHSEAVRLYEKALEIQEVLDVNDKVRRCDLLLGLGDALILNSESGRVLDDLASRALALADELSDDGRAMHACRLAIYALHTLGANSLWSTRDASLWAEAADRNAKQGTKDRVWADAFRGRVLSATGETAGGDRLLHHAMNLARELDDNATFWFAATMFLQTLQRAVPVPVWVAEQRTVALELASRSRNGVSANVLRTAFLFMAWAFLFSGDREQADRSLEEIEALWQRSRHPNAELMAAYCRALTATMAGSLEEAVEVGRFIRRRADELNLQSYASNYAYAPAFITALHLGRLDALEGFQTSSHPVVLALSGRKEELGAMMEAWLRESAGSGDSATPVSVLAYRLQVATILTHQKAIATYMEPLRSPPLPAISPSPLCVPRLLGDGALLIGDFMAAKGYFLEALEVCTRARSRPEAALARLGLAEAIIRERHGDVRAARFELDTAISELQSMGMQPALERALALRSGHPALSPPKPEYPDDLSPREVEVLRLLAAGKSNAQIAGDLMISQNTVIRHVSNIFTKAGVANRAQATAYAKDHRLA